MFEHLEKQYPHLALPLPPQEPLVAALRVDMLTKLLCLGFRVWGLGPHRYSASRRDHEAPLFGV